MKEIILKQSYKKKIMQQLGTTYPTVRAALRYETNTVLAHKIRFVALMHFGGAVSETNALTEK